MACSMPVAFAGLCSGASTDRSLICCQHRRRRPAPDRRNGPAVHHPVPDRDQLDRRQRLPASANSCCMIRVPRRGRRSARSKLTVPRRRALWVAAPVARRSARSGPDGSPRARSAGSISWYFIDDEPELITSTRFVMRLHLARPAARFTGCATAGAPCAWIAVIATVFTMSATSAPRDRSLTGLFSPCSTGPMATAFALRCTALYVLLPVFRSGKISTVARPATSESGNLVTPPSGSTAASYWMGPSTSRSGRAPARYRWPPGPSPHPPPRRRSRWSRTASPPAGRRRTARRSRAEEIAMSASCAAVGSGLTAQSP